MNEQQEIAFNTNAALMMSIKARIKEIEDMINDEKNYSRKHDLIEAKVHNEKILISLISTTMTFEPISPRHH
jgi:hypothetical protein